MVRVGIGRGRGLSASIAALRGVLPAAALVLLTPASALALAITFDLTVEFSGAQAPGSATQPWVTATFDDALDTGGANSVRLTMSSPNLTGSEFIELMLFNFDPALDPTLLTFTDVSSPTVGTTTTTTGVNAFMADGDGSFDIKFDFPPPPGSTPDRFGAGETVVYDITYTSPIDANSFNFFSDMGGGQGTFLAAAHVLNTTGAGTGGSGWIGAVPEPGTAALVSLGLLGLAAAGRRRR